MLELRWLDTMDGMPDKLQYRIQGQFADASGAVCGFGWQDWQDVPVVREAVLPGIDVKSLPILKDDPTGE